MHTTTMIYVRHLLYKLLIRNGIFHRINQNGVIYDQQ